VNERQFLIFRYFTKSYVKVPLITFTKAFFCFEMKKTIIVSNNYMQRRYMLFEICRTRLQAQAIAPSVAKLKRHCLVPAQACMTPPRPTTTGPQFLATFLVVTVHEVHLYVPCTQPILVWPFPYANVYGLSLTIRSFQDRLYTVIGPFYPVPPVRVFVGGLRRLWLPWPWNDDDDDDDDDERN